ncbi:MAG: 2TM domain-containing protein [Fimbriimonadaceae bacterium]
MRRESRILGLVADEHLQNDDDIEAILRLAVHQSSSSTGDLRARLRATAEELGLTDEQVAAAEEAYRNEKTAEVTRITNEEEEKRLWKQFRKSQRGDFVSHLGTYFVVNAFLVWLDFSQGGGLSWAYWSIAGWGIGIFTQFFKLLAGVSEENTSAFERWKAKRSRRADKGELDF